MTETNEYRNRINQIADGIKEQPELKKMRDDISEGIKTTGNRQADVEDQFQQVIENTTDKDFTSAPEIIAARNGESNLKARLDKEKQEVTAQLAQKVDEVVFDVNNQIIKFYANDKMVNSISVSEAGNAQFVQDYIDTLVADGQIEGVTVAGGAVTIGKIDKDFADLLEVKTLNLSNYNFEIGSLDLGSGKEVSSTTRFRSDTIKVDSEFIVYTNREDVKVRVFHYDVFGRMEVTTWSKQITINTKNVFRVLIAYEDNSEITNDDLLYEDVFISYRDRNISKKDISDFNVTSKDTEFLKESSNIFNKETANKGYSLLNSTGEETENSSYFTTPFYKFESGEPLAINNMERLFFYNENKEMLLKFENAEKKHLRNAPTTASGYGYFRGHGDLRDLDTLQINRSAQLMEYEEHYVNLAGYEINKSINKEEGQSGVDLSEKRPLFPLETIPTTHTIERDLDFKLLTLDEIYTGLDALEDASNGYMEKTEVGRDMTGNYPVYKLNLESSEYRGNQHKNKNTFVGKRPKIIFNAGIHGGEEPSVLATYYMLKEIVENWHTSEALEFLRFNVDFEIIPVAHPWGYVNSEYSNSTGLNIQTNFPYEFYVRDESSNVYSGTEPLTQHEAVYIKDMIDNNIDSTFYMDIHSAGFSRDWMTGVDQLFHYYLSDTDFTNPNFEYAAKNVIEVGTRQLRKNYPDLTSGENLLGWINFRDGRGTADAYAESLGVESVILELFYQLPDDAERFSPESIKATTEILINTILTFLKEIKNRQ